MNAAPPEWFADEAFWTALYPYLFTPEHFARADAEAEAVLALAGARPARLLDLCCGPGRHSVAFARRGVAVTGVDRSEFLLDKAREHAAACGASVEWVRADMREFLRPGVFDLVVNLYTAFGYFDEPRDNAAVLAHAFADLRPGGTLVLDLAGKEIVARRFAESSADEVPGAGLLVQRRRVTDGWCRMENEWLVVDGAGVRRFRFGHWLYSGGELKSLLAAAGFALVELFGSLAGGEYGPEAERLVAVARKPAP